MSDHNINETLKTVEDFYLKEQYQAALDLLVKSKDQLDAGLYHFNLGTIYAKQGNYPVARFHLEKSIKKGFYSSEVSNNLKYVNEQLSLDQASMVASPIPRLILQAKLIPSDFYVAISLMGICTILFLMKLAVIKKLFFKTLFIVISLTPLLFLYYLSTVHLAIVLGKAEVREGPSKIYKSKNELEAGTKLVIGDQYENWFFVKYPEVKSGWVNRESVGVY